MYFESAPVLSPPEILLNNTLASPLEAVDDDFDNDLELPAEQPANPPPKVLSDIKKVNYMPLISKELIEMSLCSLKCCLLEIRSEKLRL